jgi:ABC-type branched-subunit amino acid transport system permease subunit
MKALRIWGLLALLAVVLVFPVLLSPNNAVTDMAVFTLIYAMSVTGWNIFSGYTGYISLGHSVYYGIGAYTIALACQHWNIAGGYLPFLLLPLAGLVAGAFAIPLGWICLRVRRHVFIVVSIALLFIFQLLAYNLRGITNGSSGVFMPITPWSSNFFDLPFYYVALALLLLAIGVSWKVRHSKYGLGLLAIRDDEDHALGLGVKTGPYKLVAYVVSAVFVAMAGALFAYYVGIIYPQFGFDPTVDVGITLMAFLGGLGTLAGPLVGALLAEPLQYYLALQFGGNSVNLVLFGALLLVILLVLPQGIVPSLQRKWSTWMASRTKAVRMGGVVSQEQPILVDRREGRQTL